MKARIALAGNPNSGKTTLFNRLTGANQYVGNWPGVTVEKKEGKLKADNEVIVTDLPGIYSLSPYTLEEVVARDYILNEKPDAIINIVDGTNLERNLYLTDQLRELGVPMVVALNMMDLVKKNGETIDSEKLSKALGCPVCEISALKDTGIDELVKAATSPSLAAPTDRSIFDPDIEEALKSIGEIACADVPEAQKRWYEIKLFERDDKIGSHLSTLDENAASKIEELIVACEEKHDDDSESIVTSGRYDAIAAVIDTCGKRKGSGKLSLSDKIDRVVTNRWLGLPIFVVVMFLVYYLSITTVGTMMTDFVNDGLFGDGWFAGGAGREEYDEAAGTYEDAASAYDAYVAAAEAQGLDPESATFQTDAEAAGITAVYDAYDDETGENEVVQVDSAAYAEALPVLDAGEPDPRDYGPFVPSITNAVDDGLTSINCVPWLQDLIVNGIIAGVGAVLGFIPQMMVLFLLLALLESCGYMARIAFVLDRVFRRFGLSGKSFIPLLIATGCGVPGIMGSRTIENDNDRRMTVMTTTFIPCGAKLPIIALLAGAIFGGAWWVAASSYFLGIAAVLCSGIILKKTRPFLGYSAPFIMELPAYHLPTAGVVLRSMWERSYAFIKKAGTLILLATIVVWFLSGYGFVDGSFGAVEDADNSLLAAIAGTVSWIFAPLGWGEWEPVAATITGLVAKENVVGTFGILYASEIGWYSALQAAFLPVAGYSLLAFNLLCAPCFAAMGAIKREMASAKWFWAAIGYQCGIAYATALMIYQLIGLIAGEVTFGGGTVAAIVVLAFFLFLLFRPAKKRDTTEAVTSVSAANAA